MLSIETTDGYTLYIGHIISLIGLGLFGWWFFRSIYLKKMDRIFHAIISAFVCFVLLNLFCFLKWPPWIPFLVAMIVGLAKEFVDLQDKQKRLFDWNDILADFYGAGIVMYVYLFSLVFQD